MRPRTKLWYLERFPLLQVLSIEQLREVARVARYFEAERGDVIYTAADPSDSVFLLKSGVVRIVVRHPGQPEAVLAFLFPGDIFGELAITDGGARDHDAVAHEDSVLCVVSSDDLLRLIRDVPSLGYEITKVIGSHARSFRTRVSDLLYQSAPARLARAMLFLADSVGTWAAEGIRVEVRISQSDLAHLAGLSRETVNSLLQRFREQRLVEHEGQRLLLRDPEALARIR